MSAAEANNAGQQTNPELTIRNLQSACNELENINNLMRVRCAQIATERDRVTDYARALEAQVQDLSTRLGVAQSTVEAPVPAPAPKRKTK